MESLSYYNWATGNNIGQSYVAAGGRCWWTDEKVPEPYPFGGAWFYSSMAIPKGQEFWKVAADALLTFGENAPLGKWQYYETQGYTFEFEQDFLLFKLVMGDLIRYTFEL